MGVRPNTLSTPPVFPQLWIYFMIKNCQIIFPKVVYRTPPENAFMNVYFYFYSVVKCGNRALGINERIKKNFSDTKTNPNPPLSRSDRGPSGGPVPKGFRKRAPSGQSQMSKNFQKIPFSCNSSHNFTPKRNELRCHCCLSQLFTFHRALASCCSRKIE
jgi:hypothetical protein